MGFFRGPKIVTDGLIGLWDPLNIKSYPGSGTNLYDLSGNNITGTLRNTTMATTETGSMILDNVNDSISFGHHLELEPPNLTVCAWVNLLDRGDRHILITKWDGFSFEINADSRPYQRISGSQFGDLYATDYLTWGKWHHIAFTFDNINNIRYIYVDGKESNTGSDTGSIAYTQGNFNIPYNNGPSYAKGKIGIVMMYNKAISGAEIAQIYNAQKSRYL